MNHPKSMGMLLLSLSMFHISNADKIDKKGTILNAQCNPIGTKCKASVQTEVNYTYVYNEPRTGSFSMQISEQEVAKHAALHTALKNKTQILLEEPMQIPDDVIRALRMPGLYTVPAGSYNIRYHQNIYTIIFKE